jgi:hypothetical protein
MTASPARLAHAGADEFALLPAGLALDRSMTWAAKGVYAVLALRAWRPPHVAYPSQETIAADAGLSVRQVRRYLADLCAAGWLTVLPRRRQARTQGPGVTPYRVNRTPMSANPGPSRADYRTPVSAKRGGLAAMSDQDYRTPMSHERDLVERERTERGQGASPPARVVQRGLLGVDSLKPIAGGAPVSGERLDADPPAPRRRAAPTGPFFALFGALCVALRYTPATVAERAALGRAVKELLAADEPVTPAEAPRLVAAWRRLYPRSTCTANALAKHLGELRAALEHPPDAAAAARAAALDSVYGAGS